MKKLFAILLVLCVILSMGVICAAAEDAAASADVYVTISDKDGTIAVGAEKVTVTDIDADNVLTINDALYCAHEAFYDGGAKAGYASSMTQYGLSLSKLWGAENGGSYGYYVNGASAWSLTDPVNAGDYLYAFVYTDLTAWSDAFSTFDKFMGDVKADEGVELTLTYVSGYDATYMPIFQPLANAKITIDGAATDFVTDENGKVTVTFEKNGVAIVSATADGLTITPPVFRATVTGAPEPTVIATEAATEKATPDQPTVAPTTANTNTNAISTGGDVSAAIYILLCLGLFAAAVVIVSKKANEK